MRRGALAEAKGLFDGAMASASTGELGAFATGMARTIRCGARGSCRVANDALDEARAAAAELAVLAHDYDSAVLGAAAAFASGRVAFASGELDTAAARLRESQRLWLTVDAPYEGARARLELGRTLAAKSSNEAALLELRAASAVFERLGARKALDAATVAAEAMTT